jgi:hypothetical protein
MLLVNRNCRQDVDTTIRKIVKKIASVFAFLCALFISTAVGQSVFQAMLVIKGGEERTVFLASGMFTTYIPNYQTRIDVTDNSLLKTVSNYINNDSNGQATVAQTLYYRVGGGASPAFVESSNWTVDVQFVQSKTGNWIGQTNGHLSYPNNFSWSGPNVIGERKSDMGDTRTIEKGTFVIVVTNNVYTVPALFKFYCSDNTGAQWVWNVRVGVHASKIINFDAGGASAEAGHTVKWFRLYTLPSVEPSNFLVAPPKVQQTGNSQPQAKGKEKI